MRKLLILSILFVFLFAPLSTTFADDPPFITFLPNIVNVVKGGLAMSLYYPEDMGGASWFHFWGPCNSDPHCIPMSYAGEYISGLSTSYNGWIIVFNEPNAPDQANLTPQQGATAYEALRVHYPNAKMVAGNVNQDGLTWMESFKTLITHQPEAWGFHGYSHGGNTPSHIISLWEAAHNSLGGTFWITEWADIDGNVANDQALFDYLESTYWITRWAYYTNRADAWYPSNWYTKLFNSDGSPTTVGEWWLVVCGL